MNDKSKHAGIAGAGILGRLLAWQLLQRGWQVSIFDERALTSQDSCSFAAAGMLSPFVEMETGTDLIYELGTYSLQRWPEILSTLTKPVFYQQQGSFIVAHKPDRAELTRLLDILQNRLTQSTFAPKILSFDELNQLEPELSHIKEACYFFEKDAQIDCIAVLIALQEEILRSEAASWFEHYKVSHFEHQTIVVKNSKTQNFDLYQFDYIFDCRGLGAAPSLPLLRAMRGEALLLHAPEVHLTRPVRLMHPRYRLYIVPKPDQLFYLGASEIESEDYSPISVRTAMELLSAAYSIHPGFLEARIIKSMTQCRPTLVDHLPKIVSSPYFMSINGLYRHGYLLAPALVDIITHQLEQKMNQCHVHPQLMVKFPDYIL